MCAIRHSPARDRTSTADSGPRCGVVAPLRWNSQIAVHTTTSPCVCICVRVRVVFCVWFSATQQPNSAHLRACGVEARALQPELVLLLFGVASGQEAEALVVLAHGADANNQALRMCKHKNLTQQHTNPTQQHTTLNNNTQQATDLFLR